MNMQNNGNTQDNNANQYQNYYEQNGMNNQFNQNYNPQNIPINSQGTYKILSIISLLCGLLSFFMCIAVIPGIVCGGIVIQKYKKDILATIWLFLNKNTVNTRLFKAYQPQKIIFDLSHYAKSRPAWKNGRLFCVDRRKGGKK